MLPKEETSKYPRLVNATIMFADIMNSAQFASVLGLKEYDEFISEFQDISDKTITDFIKDKYGESGLNTVAEKSVLGDEAYVIFYSEKDEEDIKNIIELALILQREWFKSGFNRKRILEGKSPVYLGIGINHGKVYLRERPIGDLSRKISASGFSISLTKRVEGTSRKVRFTKIMATRNIFGHNSVKQLPIIWGGETFFECKGINESVSIKEIKLAQYEDIEIIKKMISGLDEEMLKKAFNNDPYDLWVGFQLMGFLNFNKKYQDLLNVVNILIEIEPDIEAWFTFKGLAYYGLKNFKEAIQYYDKAIELNPNYFFAHNNKGLALIELGEHEKTIGCFNKAIELKPNAPIAYNNKGIALDKLSIYEEALQCFETAIKLKPDYPEAYNDKGITLGKLDKHEEAFQCFETAIKFKPDCPEAYNNKGITLGKLGKQKEALQCFETAGKLKPDYPEAYINKGFALMKLGNHEDAIECFNRAIDIEHDHHSAYYNSACAYSQMAERDRALQNLKKACELNEGYKEKAKNDSDFDPIRDDPEFKEIVGS